jgi:hypothetical protein
VKKRTPPSPNPKPINLPEKPPKPPWTNKLPRFKNNLSRLSKPKMVPPKKPKNHNLQNPAKKKKPQRKLSRPSLHFKRPLFQKRKSNNPVKRALNNKSQSRPQRKLLLQSRLPRRLSSHNLKKKARRK